MNERLFKLFAGVFSLTMLCVFTQIVAAAEVPRMTKEDLERRLGNPDVIIVDVRTGKDWKASRLRIKGAKREDPRRFRSWADKYPKDKMIVLYCA